jgi:Zn finger protein HypA/HybF involved in hydrogenase expression
MHDGCAGSFSSGLEVLNKVRMMGFAEQYTPMPLNVTCGDCAKEFEMETFEAKCPHCGMIHAVTPCHAFDGANVAAAGHDV